MQDNWQTTGRMWYDHLLTDWNNGDHVDGGHGVLDIGTGVFTAGNFSNSHSTLVFLQELLGTILLPFLDLVLAWPVEIHTANFLCTSMANKLTKQGLYLEMHMVGNSTMTRGREQW